MRVLPLFRRCGMCHSEKPTQDFAWRRKGKGWFDNYCRPCRAEYHRRHYQANKERYKANAAARNRRVLEERMTKIISYLREHPCMDCGEDDILVLEFDHVAEKSFPIAYGIRYLKWDVLLAEIEKCEVVCANCHRRRTAIRAGSIRVILLGQDEYPDGGPLEESG